MSDSATLWYTGFLKFAGEEKGRDFMRKLAALKLAFRDSETVIMQLLGGRRVPIGSGLLTPGGDDEETRRAGRMGAHGTTYRHRTKTDRAQLPKRSTRTPASFLSTRRYQRKARS